MAHEEPLLPTVPPRRIACRDSRTRLDWAEDARQLLEEDYPHAETVTLVCDNLNTHSYGSLYYAFDAETAGDLRRGMDLVFTPKNGSWLNMAEMELSVLSRQCLGQRRFGTMEAIDAAVFRWTQDRKPATVGRPRGSPPMTPASSSPAYTLRVTTRDRRPTTRLGGKS